MLVHVDPREIVQELVALRTACNPEQNPKTLWTCLRRSVKRIRALLPDDLDMADGVSPARLQRLQLYLDTWDRSYGLSAKSGQADASDKLNRDVQRLVEYLGSVDLPGPSNDGLELPPASKETIALATLAQHPDWSDAKIALAVGCNRSSLYRWSKYTKAREILEGGKQRLPRGSKDEDGRLEAWNQ